MSMSSIMKYTAISRLWHLQVHLHFFQFLKAFKEPMTFDYFIKFDSWSSLEINLAFQAKDLRSKSTPPYIGLFGPCLTNRSWQQLSKKLLWSSCSWCPKLRQLWPRWSSCQLSMALRNFLQNSSPQVQGGCQLLARCCINRIFQGCSCCQVLYLLQRQPLSRQLAILWRVSSARQIFLKRMRVLLK